MAGLCIVGLLAVILTRAFTVVLRDSETVDRPLYG
jgi:hypothetical protein